MSSANAPRDPSLLSKTELVEIVRSVQRWLYLEQEEPGSAIWSIDKQWQSVDLCCDLASLLEAYGLLPQDPTNLSQPSQPQEQLE